MQTEDKITRAFRLMEARLKAGEAYEDLDFGLDELIGTEVEPRDPEVEAVWEQAYRESK